MSPLGAYVLSAMVSWVRIEEHASFEPRAVTEERYDRLAETMAQAATERPVVGGDPARTALVLAAIARYESSYAARVVECRTRGGTRQEPSWGPWQIARPRAEVCASELAGARLALDVVGTSVATCRAEPLSFYARGRCLARDDAARLRWTLAAAYARRHPFGEGAPS